MATTTKKMWMYIVHATMASHSFDRLQGTTNATNTQSTHYIFVGVLMLILLTFTQYYYSYILNSFIITWIILLYELCLCILHMATTANTANNNNNKPLTDADQRNEFLYVHAGAQVSICFTPFSFSCRCVCVAEFDIQ